MNVFPALYVPNNPILFKGDVLLGCESMISIYFWMKAPSVSFNKF